MRHLIFKLKNVEQDEIDGLKAKLQDNGILFYETEAGRWQIGIAGIWLPNDEQLALAQRIVHEFQMERYHSFDEERDELARKGYLKALIDHFYQNPLGVTLGLVAIVLVLGLSVIPFAMI